MYSSSGYALTTTIWSLLYYIYTIMITFKLGAFGVGKPLVTVTKSPDVTLAEVLVENNYSINSNVDYRGQQLDVSLPVGDLDINNGFLIVKGEVKTSGADERDAEIEELRARLEQYEGKETEYFTLPEPIIQHPEGARPEHVASADQQLFEWISQFATSTQISTILDSEWNEVSPYAKVQEGMQYTIVLA